MLNLNNEVWVQATRIHEVSNLGNIRNRHTKKPLKLQLTSTGYYEFFMRKPEGGRERFKVHRLVAKHFLNPIIGKDCVNHIDGNKTNNNVSNLEWCTHLENMQHASATGLILTKPRTTGMKLSSQSKYYNVWYDKARDKWAAGITINKKKVMSKRFNTEEEAALHVNHIIDTLGLTDRPKNVI